MQVIVECLQVQGAEGCEL